MVVNATNDGDWSRVLLTVRNGLGHVFFMFIRDRELASLVAAKPSD
jgi:hypothetical protein